ncbi:MAG TPA: sigma-70 family RNA polymerase sigma factor, partial [Gaiellaceae bacterium]|nr:sigma-70 family RNA polymerase sigma factor [Gaiellaceae bacterium]
MTAAGAATTEPSHVPFAAGRLEREAARARASALFVEHGVLVERLCMALLRDRQEAEDAAQQAFLSAYRSLLAGTEPREEAAWLATIARNECLQRIRARMRRPIASVELDEEAASADVHRDAVARSHAAQLWQEIRSLPDQQRDAVILREFAGLSYEELAVALGITKPAVESLLFRARGRLRSRLETAVASLNLAGAASAISDLVGRFVASGAAPRVAGLPVAAKLAAATFGIALVGGGTAVVTEQASTPHRRAAATASAASDPVAPAAALPTVAPARTVAVARSRTEAKPQVFLLASRRVARREGRDGAAREVEHRGSETESEGGGSVEVRSSGREHE